MAPTSGTGLTSTGHTKPPTEQVHTNTPAGPKHELGGRIPAGQAAGSDSGLNRMGGMHTRPDARVPQDGGRVSTATGSGSPHW